MPELPEVQTTVDELNRRIKGRKVTAVWLNWQKLKAVKKTKGHTIREIKRRGKNVLIYFDDDYVLLLHMKMTGHLLIGKWQVKNKAASPSSPLELKDKVNSYIRFILILDDGRMIGFSDLRKFGKAVFGKKEDIDNLPELVKLGPDALKISAPELAEIIKGKRKTIYQTLMDQSVVSGIGNIYANDILFQARIYPFKLASQLSNEEIKMLVRAIKTILNRALAARGTSIADYRDTYGKEGGYGNRRLVYQKEGKPCPRRCGGKIIRQKKGSRSVFFCPHCQPAS